MGRILAADGVSLHAAGVRTSLQQPVLARDGGDAAERPVAPLDDFVAAPAELADHVLSEPGLELDLERPALAGIEGAREVIRVEAGRIDRGLQVEAPVDVLQEEVERPLILLVSAGCA